MKKLVVFISLVTMFIAAQAQMNVVADVKFNSIPTGWTVSPSGSWMLENSLYVSSPTSVVGYVPNAIGDSVILT